MKHARPKRLLLGWLALAAPLPLPFNQVLEWPILFLYGLAVIYFLGRADHDTERWMPNWALNLIALIYLPFLFLDLKTAFLRQTPVTALIHMIMFLVLAKLYSVRRETDKWYLVVAIFFLFLGAMATSSHVTIVLYLVAFLALALYALAAFSYLRVLELVDLEEGEVPRLAESGTRRPQAAPIRRLLVAATVLVLVAAIPLFAAMPRIREPFILGRGGAPGIGRTTGFSDSVDLSLTSAIRANRTVAMRLRYADPVADAGELRYKGATFDRYEDRNWYRLPEHGEMLTWGAERTIRLATGEAATTAEVFLEPLGSASLLLPVETLAVTLDSVRSLGLDPGGAAVLPGLPRRETLRYEVALAREPRIVAKLDPDPRSELSALDATGVTPRMRRLAVELMGEGTAEERVDRLLLALLSGYSYTLDFVGRDGEDPLADFLFVYKSGHCEYFASAMVLLLRSEGIPARFVTGFLGAERNPLEDYYIVRQQNAHAWVEAYTPERGWQVYDPTPPDGRPAIAPPGLRLLLTQLYDYLTFRWDRYVLTYGADDQRSFFQDLRQRLAALLARLKELAGDEEETAADVLGAEALTEEVVAGGEVREPAFWQPRPPHMVLAFLVVAAGAFLWWRTRPPLTGEGAYRRLRRGLVRGGLEIDDALAPLELEARAAVRYPAAAAALGRLVALYLRESFAGQELSAAEREVLAEALGTVAGVIKADGARRRGRRLGSPVTGPA